MLNKSEYFDTMYKESHDPWQYKSRWYEERKRQICTSLLLKSHYEKALEIGCANGFFSSNLADRTQQLICLDANPTAVHLTKKRLAAYEHIRIECKSVPDEFPDEKFDLIILSEVAYYLSQNELDQLIPQLEQALNDGGMLLTCHWRHPIEHFALDGNKVHQQLKEKISLCHYSSLVDPDFLVDIWTTETQSLAKLEGII